MEYFSPSCLPLELISLLCWPQPGLWWRNLVDWIRGTNASERKYDSQLHNWELLTWRLRALGVQCFAGTSVYVGWAGKESACNAGDRGSIPGSERSPGGVKGNIHSSILAWKIPQTEEPSGLPSMGSQSWTWQSDRSTSSHHQLLCVLQVWGRRIQNTTKNICQAEREKGGWGIEGEVYESR